jgi:hypothetical protein
LQGTLNGAGILAVAGGTVFLVVKYFKKPDGAKPWLGGILVASLAAAVSALSALHGCGAGTPLFQWLVPCVCAALTLIFVDPKKKRLVFGTLFAVSAIVLSFHHVHLVHTDGYTGNPAWARKGARATGTKVRVTRLWHTWLTGLYGTQT